MTASAAGSGTRGWGSGLPILGTEERTASQTARTGCQGLSSRPGQLLCGGDPTAQVQELQVTLAQTVKKSVSWAATSFSFTVK